ncbi:SusC/RagA family TonB-linked outer membrane protein [Sphingobacterium sp. UDSM-2020]|uniref:SusC/RagA family TonB-linked outer membrane protein n=2 Tax=Sphingobacterium TaxID=28453 RepID=UPI0010D1F93C|nr:SusC/RagA family TonB-linked outer membrane protein [Sphingobacterium sp. JUb20]MCS3553165.1 TonB-linked SusC/RagA family outer membrane protein [Sphingobacterium sp. JUb21]QQD15814.1 SusC/RagA family TonB-linked outer membrane protein [Sphingobacterium sp. UDSM-2020]TCR09625.1 TonB-linked SusC/RagA family outer membrane protein [Sphingobacterium sp. JUb20]
MNNLPFGKKRPWDSQDSLFCKPIRIMKISTFLMFAFVTGVQANGIAQKVNLNLKNVKIEDALSAIGKQTKHRFLYSNDVTKGAKLINLNLKNVSLEDALEQVLNENNYSYKIIANTISVNTASIKNSGNNELQQSVSGTVRDQDGKALAGATVSVKGSNINTQTANDGSFRINASADATLLIRYVGYETIEIGIKGRSVVPVVLASNEKQIEEVVVTGMGQRVDKRLFTGATSQISGEAAQIGGQIDPSRGLEGRVAGVSVQNVTGTFGTAPKIRVRGATSIYGSSKPLWVVDGVIIEDVADVNSDELSSGDALTLISSAVAGLNAHDIESFQILKDGSATSIYGARAMAGVIVITTKKGTAGRSSLNYTGEYTMRATPLYSEFNIMNSQEQMSVYDDMYNKGYLGFGAVPVASNSGVYGDLYKRIQTGEIPNDLFTNRHNVNEFLRTAEYRNTDWFGELFQPSLQQNHSVSMSSGTEKSQYYSSISALVDPGWTKRSKVNRYTGNLNANYNISDRLKLNIITNGSYRKQQAPGTLGQSKDEVFGQVKRDFDINPYAYAMNSSRTLDPNAFYTRNYAPFNILHELENNYMDIDVADLRFQGDLKWKVIPGLELGAFGSVRYQSTSQHHYIKDRSNQAMAYRAGISEPENTTIRDKNPFLYKDPDNPYARPISVLPEGGIYNRTDYTMFEQLFRFTAQYNKTFNQNNILNVFAGSELTSSTRNNTWFRGWGLQYDLGESPFTDYRVFKRGQEENSPYFSVNRNSKNDPTNTRYRQAAFFSNVTYSYAGKYTVNGTVRYEGANKLGEATSARWMPSWNLSGAWNAHEEDFFENLRPAFSHFTLKGSYSLTGDRGPSNVTNSYAVYRSYTPWRPTAGDGESGLEIADLANNGLTYEKKHELNIGTSMGFLDNRINLEFDWFKRNNFDLIGVVNTQGLGGQISKFGNVADMKSHGAELSLTGHILRDGNFKWTSNFIYSNVKTKVTRLDTRSKVMDLITGTGFALEGGPVRGLYSIPFIRLNDEGLPVFLNEKNQETVTAINFQERDKVSYLKYEGPTDPIHTGSFGNMFNYKNFGLNVFMTYSFGNVVRLNPVFSNEYSDLTASTKEFADRWMVSGDEDFTDVPIIATTGQNRAYGNDLKYGYSAYNYSSIRTAKGDFIRMKDVSLTYDLPKSWVQAWKINSLGLRFNATNLFLIYADKKLNGQDPEFVNAGGVAAPIARQYTLTLRLGL